MVENAWLGRLVQSTLGECVLKTALITSEHRGLGNERALSLAVNHDWRILIAYRDPREA